MKFLSVMMINTVATILAKDWQHVDGIIPAFRNYMNATSAPVSKDALSSLVTRELMITK